MPGPGFGTHMTADRQQEVDRNGSPVFNYRPAAIAAAGVDTIELGRQFPRSAKYAPLDTTRVINNSNVSLEVRLNGRTRVETVPAGTIIQMTNQSAITFTITNEDGSVATVQDEITVLFNRAALTADELARRYGR